MARPPIVRKIVLLAFLFAFCSAGGGPPLGTVKELSSFCEAGPGPLPDTTCKTVRVSCPNLPDINVYLRITEPAAGVTPRGVVIFGTGGSGAFFSYDKYPPLMEDLHRAGFRLIQRAWEKSWGDRVGLLAGASRYATLVRWIRQQYGGSLPYCATGNSNGAAELAYALARYGIDDVFDLAVFSSGPWTSRLDLGCLLQPEWLQECASLVAAQGYQCAKLGCGHNVDHAYVNPDTPCADARRGDKTALDFLRNESLLAPGARLDYPNTKAYFFFGGADCGQTVPMGLKFASELKSEKVITVVPGAPHEVYSNPQGNAATRDAILKDCVKRH